MSTHCCPWPGCKQRVPARMWGCRRHWFMLPGALRKRLWANYQPGQEKSGRISRGYVEAYREVQRWIAYQERA